MKRFFAILLCLTFILGFCGCKSKEQFLKPFIKDDYSVDKSLEGLISKLNSVSKGQLIVLSDDQYPVEDLTANNAFLVCLSDQSVLASKQALAAIEAKNFTKLMTAFVLLNKELPLNEEIVITQDIFQVKSDLLRCKFTKNDKVTATDLLYGLLLRCGNDVAIPISLFASKSVSQFVKDMNVVAKSLGLNQTSFVNAYGYETDDAKQTTSLYDTFRLFSLLYEDDLFRTIIASREYTCKFTDYNNEAAGTKFVSALPYYNEELDMHVPQGLILKGGIIEEDTQKPSQMIVVCQSTSGKEYVAIIAGCTSYENCINEMQKLLSIIPIA